MFVAFVVSFVTTASYFFAVLDYPVRYFTIWNTFCTHRYACYHQFFVPVLLIRDVYPGSRISDPGSDPTASNIRGGATISLSYLFCSHKYLITNCKLFYFLNQYRKNVCQLQFTENYSIFYSKNLKCHWALKNMGLGSDVRGTGSRKKRIPDPVSWIRNTALYLLHCSRMYVIYTTILLSYMYLCFGL
jgi:hypothetical protein